MTVWRITRKIIRTAIFCCMCTIIIGNSYNFIQYCLQALCFIKVKLSVNVKLFVSLLCVRAILPAKAVPGMTYIVSGGT